MVDDSLRNLPSDVLIGRNGQSHLIGVKYLITLPARRFLCCGHSRASTGLSLEKGGASRRASVSRLGDEPPQLATGANERSLPMQIGAGTVGGSRRPPHHSEKR